MRDHQFTINQELKQLRQRRAKISLRRDAAGRRVGPPAVLEELEALEREIRRVECFRGVHKLLLRGEGTGEKGGRKQWENRK